MRLSGQHRRWSPRGRQRWSVFLSLTALALPACGDSVGVGIASLELTPVSTLAAGVGASVTFVATARDVAGGAVAVQGLVWTSTKPGVATVDAHGVATAVATGTTTIEATADGVSAGASLEVWIAPEVAAYEVGVSYFGRRGYVEYIPGDLPVVLSAPHGGALTPGEIPDRTWGETVTDSNTEETLLAVRDAFIERTGFAPHVVLSHLKRTKLDPNREVEEAAQGSPFAENAWREWHAFIDAAEEAVADRYGSGLYIDLHGHGHAIARAELGYLLSATDLGRSDAELDAPGVADRSSIRALAVATPVSFSALLRGTSSLGAMLVSEGVPAVPSPTDPAPGDDPYFSGGYDTDVHGSRSTGAVVSGVQIELPRPGIRDTEANRRAFGLALAAAVEAYMNVHYGFFAPPVGG